MKIRILKRGDKVLGITNDFIAVHRKNGEIDIVPMIKNETGLRVDVENIVTISYGANTVEVSRDNVTVTTF